MNALLEDEDLVEHRRGLSRCYCQRDVRVEAVWDALTRPGEVLKESKKGRVRRVGDWVIKESRDRAGILKYALRKSRYRRAWAAAHYLRRHGVLVPEPVAFVEHGLPGLPVSNTMVSVYLEGCRNVEKFLLAIVQRGAGKDTVELFLARLAGAVNQLCASGAYHADLSGKNIFTLDGTRFYFIDLDAVEIECGYTDDLRLKNHIQLYDSFCDVLNDALLTPFIQRMIHPGIDPRQWLPKVREGQLQRRARLERARERQMAS